MAAKPGLANGRHQRPFGTRTPSTYISDTCLRLDIRQAHRPCPRHILIHHRRHHLPHRRQSQRHLRRKRILPRRHQPKAVHHAVTTHRHGCLLLPLRRPRLLGESPPPAKSPSIPERLGPTTNSTMSPIIPDAPTPLPSTWTSDRSCPAKPPFRAKPSLPFAKPMHPFWPTLHLLPSAVHPLPHRPRIDQSPGRIIRSLGSPVGLHSLWWVPITPCFDSVEIQVLILPTTTATVAYPAIPLNLGVPTLCQGAPQAWPTFTSGNSGGTFFRQSQRPRPRPQRRNRSSKQPNRYLYHPICHHRPMPRYCDGNRNLRIDTTLSAQFTLPQTQYCANDTLTPVAETAAGLWQIQQPKPDPDNDNHDTDRPALQSHTPTHTEPQVCCWRLLRGYSLHSLYSTCHRQPRLHLPPKWQLLPRRPRSMALDPRQRRLILRSHHGNHRGHRRTTPPQRQRCGHPYHSPHHRQHLQRQQHT